MTAARAAVLAIGDELVLGQSLDTNSAWISERLASLGLRVSEHVTVEDDLDLIASSIERLAARVQLVIMTGGLGPPPDDLTRAALALVMGEPLETAAQALEELKGWFGGRGTPMPEANAIQATRPRTARMLANPRGTAPGLHASLLVGTNVCEVLCLPGPPREMRPMFDAQVPELLARTMPERLSPVCARLVRTFGIGESNIAQLLGDLLERTADPLVGTTASGGVVTVRIRSEAGDNGRALGSAMEDEVCSRLGPALVLSRVDPGTDDGIDPVVSTITRLLRERGETIGTVESCTGGGIGAALTDPPGASDVFHGGLVVYDDAHKVKLAGIEPSTIKQHGAVSAEVAIELADRGCERLSSDHCIAVTGIAGPSGGTEAKPVGTVWIAASGGGTATEARRFLMRGGRDLVRERSARAALGMVRLRMLGHDLTMLAEAERRT